MCKIVSPSSQPGSAFQRWLEKDPNQRMNMSWSAGVERS